MKEFGNMCWTEVYNRIIGAVVFIDDASAECLHWEGGFMNLLNGGAVAVKSLSPFESADKEHKKAVFITQTTSTQLQTIREIINVSNFSHCILISAASFEVVYLELNEGEDAGGLLSSGKAPGEANKRLNSMLLDWMKNPQSSVEIVHIPIFTISPTNVIFLTPPHSTIFPSYDGKLIPSSPAFDLYTLENEEREQMRRLASSLNSMFQSMNLKEDVFFIGTYSSILAGILDNNPVSLERRKNCTNQAALILLDRSMDLASVTSHSLESMLDKVMSVLPRFPGHSTDVAVDMSPLCEANVSSGSGDVELSPGCLYHANDESSIQTFKHMINKSQKEVMLHLYNKLSRIDLKSPGGSKTLTKVTPQSVEKIVSATKGNYEVIKKNLGLLQQSLAIMQTLKSPQHAQIELIMNLEKQVLQNLATSMESTSVLNQISHIIKTRKERNLCLDRLLALLIYVYSLAGNDIAFSTEHEENLRDTLSEAIFEDQKDLLMHIEDIDVTKEKCAEIAANIIEKLQEVALIRVFMFKYTSVIKPSEAGTGHEYRGVFQQMLDDVVDPEITELRDLHHKNEGIKGELLRSFSTILLPRQKMRPNNHPLENPVVILYVIGGVTAEECMKLHRSFITSGVDAQFLIGATKMTTQVETMRDIFRI